MELSRTSSPRIEIVRLDSIVHNQNVPPKGGGDYEKGANP